MKKWLIVLSMIICMATLSACGKQEQGTAADFMPDNEAKELVDSLIKTIEQISVFSNGDSEMIAYYAAQLGIEADIVENAVTSWKSAAEEMGSYVEVMEIIENSMQCEQYNGVNYPLEGTISVRIKGSGRNATFEMVCEDYGITNFAVNLEYTFAENMKNAALNTLLGMGTVFAVLILISFIIAAFGLIPKLMEKKSKPVKNNADDVIAQIEEREELSDDTELVAVISAAIAAYEGSGSTDGFVVRSIRRTGRI